MGLSIGSLSGLDLPTILPRIARPTAAPRCPAHQFVSHTPSHRRGVRPGRLAARASAAPTAASPAAPPCLPPDVAAATAVLRAGDAEIYLLGVSHVSKESVRHVRELIAAVRPDAVVLELCKDRTGLLVDPDAPMPQTWHSPVMSLSGYTERPGWAAPAELLGGLKSGGSRPVSGADIEDDALALLATGLFGSVRPVARPPGPADAPAFVAGGSGGGALAAVAPLAAIEFLVTERQLPPLTALAVEFASAELEKAVPGETVAKIEQAAAAGADGAAAVPVLMDARAALLAALEGRDVAVEFSSVETGRVTAKVMPKSGGASCLTGLEASAVGGRGPGIQPFRRQTPPRPPAAAASPAPLGGFPAPSFDQGVAVEPWSESDLAGAGAGTGAGAGAGPSSAGGLAGGFATALTQEYAKYQGAAGRAVGVGPGAAWQAALEAAAAVGAPRVHLGDRPAGVTALRLAQGIWRGSAPLLLGSIPAAIAGALLTAGPAADALGPGPAALAAPAVAAVLPLAAALWPVAAPLLEVRRFSQMSGTEIEDTVRLAEPLQGASTGPLTLWGEDALIKWPGALDPVITERDEYMARAIVAAAAGGARPQGLTPAYVRGVAPDGQVWYRYAMPKGGEPGVCPPGQGDGTFDAAAAGGAARVVAVVGTAHVRGMLRVWDRVAAPGADLGLSQFVES